MRFICHLCHPQTRCRVTRVVGRKCNKLRRLEHPSYCPVQRGFIHHHLLGRQVGGAHVPNGGLCVSGLSGFPMLDCMPSCGLLEVSQIKCYLLETSPEYPDPSVSFSDT